MIDRGRAAESGKGRRRVAKIFFYYFFFILCYVFFFNKTQLILKSWVVKTLLGRLNQNFLAKQPSAGQFAGYQQNKSLKENEQGAKFVTHIPHKFIFNQNFGALRTPYSSSCRGHLSRTMLIRLNLKRKTTLNH